MDTQTKKEVKTTVDTITGRLDAVTAPEYENKLNELIAAEKASFVVDSEGLDYISSAGLRALLTTAKRLKGKGGQIRFANVKGTVKEVFDISGFGSIFQMDDSVAAALAKIGRRPMEFDRILQGRKAVAAALFAKNPQWKI